MAPQAADPRKTPTPQNWPSSRWEGPFCCPVAASPRHVWVAANPTDLIHSGVSEGRLAHPLAHLGRRKGPTKEPRVLRHTVASVRLLLQLPRRDSNPGASSVHRRPPRRPPATIRDHPRCVQAPHGSRRAGYRLWLESARDAGAVIRAPAAVAHLAVRVVAPAVDLASRHDGARVVAARTHAAE